VKPEGWFDKLRQHDLEMSDLGWFDRPDYYGRDGTPITFSTWVALFEDMEYRVIERAEFGEIVVSTVWLGLDHSFGYGELPMIFETIVFAPETFPLDGEMFRYATEEQAREGHADMVARVRSLLELLA
jgi:hypothetical protein